MLEKVKLFLRIAHSLLDDEIEETIAEARAELIRAGVDADIAAAEDNDLITRFVKTFCKAEMTDNKDDAVRYEESWKYQLDNIRKSIIEEA